MDGSKNCNSGNNCACGGTGPAVTRFLEAMVPAGGANEHFRKARVEFLKGIRELVDQRINSIERQGVPEQKGAKISID